MIINGDLFLVERKNFGNFVALTKKVIGAHVDLLVEVNIDILSQISLPWQRWSVGENVIGSM